MLLDVDTLKRSSEMDPQIIEFVKNNPAPPLDWDDAGAAKALMGAVSKQTLAMLGPPEAAITEEYKDIPMRDGFQSSIKIHRPTTSPADGSPLIVFCFGGGWVGGDNDAGTGFSRAWVRLFGAVVVNISYRLGPEVKFPTNMHDAIDSVRWLAEHASDIGADPRKGFVVGGMSAGGTLTNVIANESLINKFAHPITGQWLCVASLMKAEHVPEKYKPYFHSLEHNKDAPILPTSALESLKRHCNFDDSSPLRWPILYDEKNRSRLPPAYIQADGMDPLRDDALIYDEMLKEAGVKSKIDFYPGCPHAHFGLMPGIEISNRATADTMVGIGWLLGKQITPEQGLMAMVPAS